MKNSGINKTDESWYCHCLISYAVLSVIALKELSWHPRNNWVNWRISHMSNSEAMGTSKEIRITKGRQTPRVWDHTQSHPAVWEVVFSFSKKEEEWVFLFEWKRNKEKKNQSSRWWATGGWFGVCYKLFKPQYAESKTRSLVSVMENWDVAGRSSVRWHASGRWSTPGSVMVLLGFTLQWAASLQSAATEGDTHDK